MFSVDIRTDLTSPLPLGLTPTPPCGRHKWTAPKLKPTFLTIWLNLEYKVDRNKESEDNEPVRRRRLNAQQ